MRTQYELPNVVETEGMVLANIVYEPQSLLEVSEILMPLHFYDSTNREIFELLLELDVEGIPIDHMSIIEMAKKKGMAESVNAKSITKNLSLTLSGANIKYHSRLIVEKHLLREMIRTCWQIESRATKSGYMDVFQFLSEAESSFNSINEKVSNFAKSKDKLLGQLMIETVDEVIQARKLGINTNAITFDSFPTFNKLIGGIVPGDLIGIYGREKSTKSTLAFSLLLDLSVQNIGGAFFSFEMQQSELVKKSLSLFSGVDYTKIRNPLGFSEESEITNREIEKLENLALRLKNNNMIIIDEPLNEYQISAKIRRLIKKYNIRVVVIDYLMLINSAEKFRQTYEELNHLSKFFKRLAMQLKIAIIVVSQSDYSGERTAQGLGLQRDSNYFFYIERKTPGTTILMKDSYSELCKKFTFQDDQFLVTLKGSRHSMSNRSFIVQYLNNKYLEVEVFKSETENKEATPRLEFK